jgi:hypothetical protein
MSMGCDYYRILYNDIVIAEHMTIETTMLVLKALFLEYWQEPSCSYIVEKMEEEDARTNDG